MESIGLFEAKTHFSALLERVANGETIEITRRGRPVALLTPPERPVQRDLRKVVEEIKKIRKRNRLGPGLTIRQLIDEGRRF
jgi:prevent-host-death family protein